jgi:hypothetical protein
MSGSLEEAYVAVERAYGQGDFATALQLAVALRPQVQAGRPDLLDQRLQLLLGHIHLYGLNQPGPAATAYAAVLESCNEPAYRDLASQGLDLSRQQLAATPGGAPETAGATPWEPAAPGTAAGDLAGTPGVSQASPQPQNAVALPATPWLSQLQDPQLALQQIQTAPAAVATPATTEPAPEVKPEVPPAATATEAVAETQPIAGSSDLAVQPAEEPGPAADTESMPGPLPDPEAIIPVVVTVEEDIPAQQEAVEVSATANAEGMAAAEAEPAQARFSEEEWAKLSRGLLLVELSSSQEI